MPHGHGPAGENPEEIFTFANSFLKRGKPLARILDQGTLDDETWATFKTEASIVKAELCFTRSKGKWQDREWDTLPAQIDTATSRVKATVPKEATVFYLNLFDDRNCAVSSAHAERQ